MPSNQHLRNRLAELKVDIPALKAKLEAFTAEQNDIVAALGAIVYPIHTLPVEILELIFAKYLESPHIGGSRFSTAPSRGPLLLASVCRAWRTFCLSLPTLWDSLDVYPRRDYRYPEEYNSLLILMQSWLLRSSPRPVLLRIGTCSRQDLINEIFFTIAAHSGRLRVLELSLQRIFKFPDDMLHGQLPTLERLKISTTVSSYTDTNTDRPLWSGFGIAPRLREVVLEGVFLRQIVLPWEQLAHLTLSGVTLLGCLEILQLTPQLETLGADLRTDNYLFHGPLPPSAGLPSLVLSRLRTLTVGFSEDGGLLEQLTLPAVKDLNINGMNNTGPPSPVLPRLMNLAERSQWPLTALGFTRTWPSNIVECLSAIQQQHGAHGSLQSDIQSLFIELRPNHTGTHLNRLLQNLASAENLPNLKRLEIEGCPVDLSISHLLAMVASRRPVDSEQRNQIVPRAAGHYLESLRLSFLKPDDTANQMRLRKVLDGLMEGLNRFEECGLRVVLSTAE
ncbi:hypothetical protein C8F01DRAFT_1137844 [Mycena amicta]|nr:hypothetical protein C8F01DRAFT_1137844 [Mycena amicta]